MPSLLEKLDAGEVITCLVTGAAGQIAYSLLPLICRGALLGAGVRVKLHLLEVAAALPRLAGVVMELEDLASPLQAGVLATADEAAAFAGADVALLLGAKPRGPGEERSDLLKANAAIFAKAGALLASAAAPDVKVLVVGNPANTNALIAATAASGRVPGANFTALTRLDQNRATALLARHVGVAPDAVRGVAIWGNHSTTQVPDASAATVAGAPLAPQLDGAWLRGDFITAVQQRGKAVIDARGASSAASAAHAICQHVHDWLLGAEAPVSMGVLTDAACAAAGYCATPGLVFSLPVTTRRGGAWALVPGWPLDEAARARLAASEHELLEERTLALATVSPATA